MKLAYLSTSYVPSRRASSVQVMKMCSAFSRAGHEVRLVTKRSASRQEHGVADEFTFYGVSSDFSLVKLSRPAVPGGGLVYAAGLLRFLGTHRSQIDLAYCRDLAGAWLATRLALPTVMEVHEPMPGRPQRLLMQAVLRSASCQRLIAISKALAEDYRATYPGTAADKLLVAHDGADLPQPLPRPGRLTAEDAKARGRLRVGYVGQLYPGKGLEILVPLAERVPEADFEIVGGTDAELARLARQDLPPNLKLLGFVPPGRLAGAYDSFDVVLMPYQRRVNVAGGRSDAGRWMSPLKMFEYMAAAKPIVASDLPVLREVLDHGRNALLVPTEDLDAWTSALRRLAMDPDLRDRLGSAARSDLAERYTWSRRAEAVLAGLALSDR